MNTLIETIEYKGYSIECHIDENADSPDSWGNNDCFLVYDHRDFMVEVKGFDPNEIFEDHQKGKVLFHKWGDKTQYFIFPVLAYIHSGVALSLGRSTYPFTDPWDTSFKGFALVKKEKGMGTRDKARKYAEGLIETWNVYLSGSVCGFIVRNESNEHLDSCWGYYEQDYCITSAKEWIDATVKEKIKSHFDQVKTWIKNRVPLLHRAPLAEFWENELPIMA